MESKLPQQASATGTSAAAPHRLCLSPGETYNRLATVGGCKLGNSIINEVVLGLLAGAFIGFGFTTCMLAAGQLSAQFRASEPGIFNFLFGIYGFPTGLTLVVLSGASLFTGNVMFLMASYMERKTTLLQGAWLSLLSYFANLAGSLLLAQIMISGQVFAGREAFTIALAVKKVSVSFGTNLVRGMLCNWLVCMALWQANAAQDIAGKILGVFLPVSAFVTGGFEHCVANMFMMPLGIMLGAPITARDFITKNLIPVTLGNTISGAIFVAMSFGFSYGTPEKMFRKLVEDRVWSAVRSKTVFKADEGKSTLPVAGVTSAEDGGVFSDDSCHIGRQP